eukprot:1150277-Pelagomonas_calceolata.AAC.7
MSTRRAGSAKISANLPRVHAGVTRALCAAFPVNSEPSVCKESWVSEDECEVDGPGYAQCRVGSSLLQERIAKSHVTVPAYFEGWLAYCALLQRQFNEKDGSNNVPAYRAECLKGWLTYCACLQGQLT